MLYRKECKNIPLVYRSDKFTPEMLENFIETSNSFKVMSQNQFENIFKSQRKLDFKIEKI
jgi:hypothetical protein